MTTEEQANVPPSRWAGWERDVLAKVPLCQECLRLISQRRNEVDDDNDEASLIRSEFWRQLEFRNHTPEFTIVFIPSRIAAAWIGMATNERWATNRASAHLKALQILELKKTKKHGSPGWCWRGSRVRQTEKRAMLDLNPLPNERDEENNAVAGAGRAGPR
jgi:hypothetical protein